MMARPHSARSLSHGMADVRESMLYPSLSAGTADYGSQPGATSARPLLESRSLSSITRSSTSAWDVRRSVTGNQPPVSGVTTWNAARTMPPQNAPMTSYNAMSARSMTTQSVPGELRVVGSGSSDPKRLRSAPAGGDRTESQASEDMTLRYSSQTSESLRAPSQGSESLLMLRDSERVARLENKIDELLNMQKSGFDHITRLHQIATERIEETIRVVRSLQSSMSTDRTAARPQTDSSTKPSSSYRSSPVMTAPPKFSLFEYDSEAENEAIFSDSDPPKTAEELFAKARRARDNRRKLQQPQSTRDVGITKAKTTQLIQEKSSLTAARSDGDVADERTCCTWNGYSIEPSDIDDRNAQLMMDMVDYLAKELRCPKRRLMGLVLQHGGSTHNRARFVSPSGKVFSRRGPKALQAFRED